MSKRDLPPGFSRFDVADYLTSEKEIEAYLRVALEEDGDDPEYIAHVQATAERARKALKNTSAGEPK